MQFHQLSLNWHFPDERHKREIPLYSGYRKLKKLGDDMRCEGT
jgi:hypothetical protein